MFDVKNDNQTVFVPEVIVWGIIVMSIAMIVLWCFDSLYMDALLTEFSKGCYALVMYVENLL